MKYSHNEVIDIINLTKENPTQNPEEIINLWLDKKANTKLDLTQNKYNIYVYSFPLTLNSKDVATITLAGLYSYNNKDELMLKYFGRENFDLSWNSFSHDTHIFCYLTIHEEFELPEITDGFSGHKFQAMDANNNPFEVKVSYGYPDEEKNTQIYHQWVEDKSTYRFDIDFNINIKTKPNGWFIGQKINENIDKRLIQIKREEKINSIIK